MYYHNNLYKFMLLVMLNVHIQRMWFATIECPIDVLHYLWKLVHARSID